MSWFDEIAQNRALKFGAGGAAVAAAVAVGLVIGSSRNSGGGIADVDAGLGTTTTTVEETTTTAFGNTTTTFFYDPTSTLPALPTESTTTTAAATPTTAVPSATTTVRPGRTTTTTAAPPPPPPTTTTTTPPPSTTTTTFPPGSARVTLINKYPRGITIVINGARFDLAAGETRGPVAVPSSASPDTTSDVVEVSVPERPTCGDADRGSIFAPDRSYAVSLNPNDQDRCGPNGDDPRIEFSVSSV